MLPCTCGKASYPSAAKAYEALTAQRRRVKHSRKSKKRLSQEAWAGSGKLIAYQCAMGVWHHGYGEGR